VKHARHAGLNAGRLQLRLDVIEDVAACEGPDEGHVQAVLRAVARIDEQ
jgi:hypothetical protein